jgi:hypothetical protein
MIPYGYHPWVLLTHPPVLEIFKDPILVCNRTSQKNKVKRSKNRQLFHNNHRFFKVFEVTGTGGSLILE